MLHVHHSLDEPWAMGSVAYQRMKSLIPREPKKIVEFGSGASTVHLANDFPRAKIFSFEHSEEFLKKTRRRLSETNLGKNVTLIHYDAKNISELIVPEAVKDADFLFVDGPPGGIKGGREAAGMKLIPHLRVGAIVVIDDLQRPNEAAAAKRWCAAFNLKYSEHRVGHWLGVMRKK